MWNETFSVAVATTDAPSFLREATAAFGIEQTESGLVSRKKRLLKELGVTLGVSVCRVATVVGNGLVSPALPQSVPRQENEKIHQASPRPDSVFETMTDISSDS